MDLLSKSVEEQKKSDSDSAELLKDLLISMKNLGKKKKNVQKEMDY